MSFRNLRVSPSLCGEKTNEAFGMQQSHSLQSRRGITVLALVVLILVLVALGFFLFRYLSPAAPA